MACLERAVRAGSRAGSVQVVTVPTTRTNDARVCAFGLESSASSCGSTRLGPERFRPVYGRPRLAGDDGLAERQSFRGFTGGRSCPSRLWRRVGCRGLVDREVAEEGDHAGPELLGSQG